MLRDRTNSLIPHRPQDVELLKDVAKGVVDESPASSMLGKRVDKLISSLEKELQEVRAAAPRRYEGPRA
mgnify:CR=1 FL=1